MPADFASSSRQETSSDRLVSTSTQVDPETTRVAGVVARHFFFGHELRVRRAILAGAQVLPVSEKEEEEEDVRQKRIDCLVAAKVDNSEAGPTS